MSLELLTRRESVLEAMAEFDAMGREAFLAKYGYRPSRGYLIEHAGRSYDSKAIAGVAVGKEHPDRGALRADEFSGGDATVRAKLQELGFSVSSPTGPARFDAEGALQVLAEIMGAPPRRTKYLAAWDLPTGEQFALQLAQEGVRVWTEQEPPTDLSWTSTYYPADKSRHGNLEANAPRLYLPNPAWLSHVRSLDGLRRLASWVLSEDQPRRGLDESALRAARDRFLASMSGFTDFEAPGETYLEHERRYKDELCALFASEVAPLAKPSLTDAEAEALGRAYHRLLTRSLSATKRAQNLVPWQAVERLRPDSAPRLAVGHALGRLIAGEGDQFERLNGFVREVGEALRAAGTTGPNDMARVLGSCALMLAEPQAALVVRYGLFQKAVPALLGEKFPSYSDEPARYQKAVALAELVRRELEGWGWKPKDMMDVQGFLWVAFMYDPAKPEADDAFATSMAAFLERFAQLRTGPFAADLELRARRERVVEIVRDLAPVKARPELLVEMSVGKGNWASVAWLALMDRRETTTTRQGLHVVFLIAEDLSQIYLTLAQGVTLLAETHGQAVAGEVLKTRAEAARQEISGLREHGFRLDNDVSLVADGWRARNYETSVIAHQAYAASDLPSDTELAGSLEALLSAYADLLASPAAINETRPCWFVGANWADGGDQTERFVREGVWENGYEEGPTLGVVRQMRPGDRIAIKAAHTRRHNLPFAYPSGQMASAMRIKATGVITANPGNGRQVSVAWQHGAPRDWYFYTSQKTIWRVSPESEAAKRLIAFAFEGAPQDYDWFLADMEVEEEPVLEPTTAPRPEEVAAEPYSLDDALKGLFMEREEVERILRIWRAKKNLILQGAPGVGKSFVARRLAFALMKQKAESRLAAVQFHQSYGYEDFIQGFRPTATGGFALRDAAFLRFCRRALADQDRDYVFIIDEINRGNLSKIFGELMLLIEHDKRSKDWRARLAYAGEDEPEFWLPKNLYILGMMNTADRSLSLVDYALRRRFAFVGLNPAFDRPGFSEHLTAAGVPSDLIGHIRARMIELNREIAEDQANLGPGFQIGHSFFTPGEGFVYEEGWLEQVIETEIRPLIMEYWFDAPSVAESHCARLLERP